MPSPTLEIWKPPGAGRLVAKHEGQLRAIERDPDPPWNYVLPILPAIAEDGQGYDPTNPDYSVWEEPWSNISDEEFATAYRIIRGHLAVRIYATGGEEETLPSLMFMLPENHWPPRKGDIIGRVGTSTIMYCQAWPTGEVVYVGRSLTTA